MGGHSDPASAEQLVDTQSATREEASLDLVLLLQQCRPHVLHDFQEHFLSIHGEFDIKCGAAFKGELLQDPLTEPVDGEHARFVQRGKSPADPAAILLRVRTGSCQLNQRVLGIQLPAVLERPECVLKPAPNPVAQLGRGRVREGDHQNFGES